MKWPRIGLHEGRIYFRLSKHKYIKPRICPDCHKFEIIARDPRGNRCRKCSRRQHRHNVKAKMREKRKALGLAGNRYGTNYQTARRHLLKEHPYCSLCGCSEHLTVHHVGKDESGQRLTVLCFECHQAYEAWAQKKTIKGRMLWMITGSGRLLE